MMLAHSRPNPKPQGIQAWALMILRAGFERGLKDGSLIVGFQQYVQVNVSPHAMLLSLRKMEPMARGKIRFSGHRLRFSGEKNCCLVWRGLFLFFHEVIHSSRAAIHTCHVQHFQGFFPCGCPDTNWYSKASSILIFLFQITLQIQILLVYHTHQQ